jgi:hypothetical protein
MRLLMKIVALHAVATVTLTPALASIGATPRSEGGAKQVQTEPARTGKERLSGKASDEQRVDNCKVPIDLRGSTPRPDGCDDGARMKESR